MRAIIFDLNGIFIKSPPLSKRFESDFGVPAGEFLAVLEDVMAVVRRPSAPGTFALFEPHLKRWGIALGEDAFYQYWFGAEKADQEMVFLARELRSQGMQIFALSNNFRERCEYYHTHFSFMADIFTELRYSWQTGFLKPDPQCWSSILQKYCLRPADVVYFDDSPKNVAVAQALGISAHNCTTSADIKRVLGLAQK